MKADYRKADASLSGLCEISACESVFNAERTEER